MSKDRAIARSESSAKRAGPRKTSKKRKEAKQTTLQYPQRLEPGEDADEDVTAPKGQRPQYMHLNQSVFSLIAAAGSKADFHARFDDDSSGSDTEQEGPSTATTESPDPQLRPDQDAVLDASSRARSSERQGAKRSESRLLRSLPKVNIRTKKEKNYMSQSIILPQRGGRSPPNSARAVTPRDAPVMSRMLEARAQLEPEEPLETALASDHTAATEGTSKHTSLKERLMEIFGFEKPEEVISGLSPLDNGGRRR